MAYYNPYSPGAIGAPNNYVNYSVPLAAPQQTPGIVWVQGEAGAKSYLVGAGQSVLLMVSENSVFYIKSTDQSGMPMPLRVYDYTERTQTAGSAPEPIDMTNYVTKDELKQYVEELRASFGKAGE